MTRRLLETMTWQEAEEVLTPDAVVLVPLGGACKEHGPHLPLNNDFVLALRLAERVANIIQVVVAPVVPFSYYPAFVEYPGSITLSQQTARDLIVDICRSLSRFGPKKFYVLNTGVSTRKPLQEASEELQRHGVRMRFTDWSQLIEQCVGGIREQEGGGHADEIETSIMLYLAPQIVDMSVAVNDYTPGEGPLTRKKGGKGVYSPSGVWGDATLATNKKGAKIVRILERLIVAEIYEMQRS